MPNGELRYESENIQLYLGDCLEVIGRFEPRSFDALITDPPYFIPVQTYVGVRGAGWKRRTLSDMSVMQLYFDTIFQALCEKLKPEGTAYIFCDGQSYPLLYRSLFPHFKYVRPLIWDKVVSYNGYTWRHQHELIAWGEGQDAPRIPTGDGDVLRFRGVLQKDRLHPAEKPVELLSRLIEKSVPLGGLILEPFAGSCSTLLAGRRLGRRVIGIELAEEYIVKGITRLEAQKELL